MDAIFNNPIAWSHFRIRGGWKNHLWSTAGYAFLITAVIGVTYRLSVGSGVLMGWTAGLLGLQAAILGLYGCSVVGNAVRRDISSGLLESHRLMPVSAGTAVFGYVTGPTFQAICLAIANLVIGTVTGSIAQVPLDRWYVSNAVVVTFIAFLWVCFAYASFVAKNAYTALFGLIFGSLGSGGGLINLVPALAVLLTPISGKSIFSLVSKGTIVTPALGYGLAAQVVFGAIFFRGAMRRYRRDDVPALGTALGLLLLAAWVGTSALGIVFWSDVDPVFMHGGFDQDLGIQTIGSIVSSMLIGLVCIGSSAKAMTEWQRTRRLAGRAPERKPAPPPLVALMATLIVPPIAIAGAPHALNVGLLLRLAVIVGAFFFSTSYLLRIFYRRGQKAAILIAVWLVLTWLIPLGVDAVRHSMSDLDAGPLFSLLSPIGAMIDLFDPNPSGRMAGLIFQALIAVAAAGMFYSGEKSAVARVPNAQQGIAA